MNDPEQGSSGGWSVGKVLGIVVALLGMAGFGFCGLCGLVLGVANLGDSGTAIFVICGAIGLVIAAGFLLIARAVHRGAQRKPPETP
jgi:hypothetical protein